MHPKTVVLLAVAMYTLSCRSTRMSAAHGASSGQPTTGGGRKDQPGRCWPRTLEKHSCSRSQDYSHPFTACGGEGQVRKVPYI